MSITLNGITPRIFSISPAPGAVPGADKEAQKELGAARDFESLLIAQMLRSIREEGSGWLGTGDDDAGATAVGFGEEQLARALTKGSGLGLSKVIASGLAVKSAALNLKVAKNAEHAEQSGRI
jgi:Rod binding domain-containing protein